MRLVVNRRTAPKPKAKPKRATVKAVLASCLDAAAEFDAVLVVGHRRDGPTQLAWSDQTNSDLVWLAEFAAHHVKADAMQE